MNHIPYIKLTMLLSLAAFLTLTSRAQIDTQRMLAAIAEIETGNNPHAVGAAHERSQYQITPSVWRQHSKRTHNSSAAEAKRVASAHIEWICADLRRNHVDITAYNVALAWNGGLSRVYLPTDEIPARVLRYAEHCANVYGTIR